MDRDTTLWSFPISNRETSKLEGESYGKAAKRLEVQTFRGSEVQVCPHACKVALVSTQQVPVQPKNARHQAVDIVSTVPRAALQDDTYVGFLLQCAWNCAKFCTVRVVMGSLLKRATLVIIPIFDSYFSSTLHLFILIRCQKVTQLILKSKNTLRDTIFLDLLSVSF